MPAGDRGIGALDFVLHAHLPYVRSSEPGSLEEDWYFQALQECYLPLLEVLERTAADPQQRPRLTLGLSPTLLSLLSDPDLNGRFPAWIALRRQLLQEAPPTLAIPAHHLEAQLGAVMAQWQACGSKECSI